MAASDRQCKATFQKEAYDNSGTFCVGFGPDSNGDCVACGTLI